MDYSTFHLNRDFVERLVDLYHDDQVSLFEALKEDARHNSRSREGSRIRPPLSKERMQTEIAELIEVAFWASLTKEEGRHHAFALVYSSPHRDTLSHSPGLFSKPSEFLAETLAKLAPALQSTATIGVWRARNGNHALKIWGFAPPYEGPYSSLLIKAIEPGQIILWISDMWKASITGIKAQLVDRWTFRDIFEAVAASQAPNEHPIVQAEKKTDLAKVALAMRAHGHGGTLLVVPNDNSEWCDSVEVGNFRLTSPYQKTQRDLEKRDEVFRQLASGKIVPDFHSSLERVPPSLESIAQFTAVDGATVVTPELTVLAFGVKITPRELELETLISEPFERTNPERTKPKKMKLSEMPWGTRHKSAARFVFDQQGTLAIVASVDGRLSVLKREGARVAVTQYAEYLWL